MVYYNIDGELYGMKTGEGAKCKKCVFNKKCGFAYPSPCVGLSDVAGGNFYFTQDFIQELLKALNEET